ncbi:MAG: hypothetical protein ACRDPI_03720 [Nocardioidaceae bacterium]
MPTEPREALRFYARNFFDFSVADLARAYAPAVATLERLHERLAALGITRTEDVDLYVALVGGLVDAQLANDPDGDRWSRLLDRTMEM